MRWSQIEFWVRKVQSIEFPGQKRRGTHLARRCQHHAAIMIIFSTHINNFIQLKQNLELIMLPPTFISSYHDESSVSKIEYKTIGKTDMVVSNLSFGASSLGGVFRQTDDQESGT